MLYALFCGSVHPHGCGDNFPTLPHFLLPNGSPPRVWGQRTECPTYPATATVHPHGCGDNPCIILTAHIAPVHPHGCGDNFCGVWFYLNVVGSPPRVWGQHIRHIFGRGEGRFTPTGVGTTFFCTRCIIFRRFTPTGVGTTNSKPLTPGSKCGSPPRVWGQRAPESVAKFH